MSLATDQFFFDAIRNDADIVELTSGRIYNTATPYDIRTEPEKDILPYIVISFAGLQNDQGTKDDRVESDTDNVTIEVTVVAENRESLADLLTYVRPAIMQAVEEQDRETEEEYGFIVDDYNFTASTIQLDPSRPCHFITLTYQCEINNIQS